MTVQPALESAPSRAAGGRALPFPPHRRFENFLPEPLVSDLVAWTIANEDGFEPAPVFYGAGGRESRIDPSFRKTFRLRDLGPFADPIKGHLDARRGEILSSVGHQGPDPASIELELNAYGDGGRFRPHIDIPVGENRRNIGERAGQDRTVSAVFYFHKRPKAFTGGALRLYRFGAAPGEHDDTGNGSIAFEPQFNSLIAFPAWALHSVDAVHCSTQAFADSRFALNCWLCR